MYILKKSRINKFRVVIIPKPRDLFTRYGARSRDLPPCENGQIIPMNMSKIDLLQLMEDYDKAEQARVSAQRKGTDTASSGDNPSNDKPSD